MPKFKIAILSTDRFDVIDTPIKAFIGNIKKIYNEFRDMSSIKPSVGCVCK